MNTLPSSLTSLYGSAQLNLWDFRGSGVDPTGTNDSTAGVQAAINQAAATGQAADIYVPPGTYALGGAIQSPSSANAQVLLPNLSGSSAGQMPSIRLRGLMPGRNFGLQGGSVIAANAVTRFKSSATSGFMFGITGPSSANPFSQPIDNGSFPGTYFSGCGVIFENIEFTTGLNPSVGCMNLGLALWAQVRNVAINDTTTSASRGLPTHAAQAGLIMPYEFNYGAGINRIDGLYVVGQYTGVQTGEHTVVTAMQVGFCHTGLFLGTAEHVTIVNYYCCQHNYYGIATGPRDGYSTTNYNRAIINMTIEANTTDAFGGGFELYDPNNYGAGVINYSVNKNNPNFRGFTQSGGTGWVCTSMSAGGANP